MTIYSEYILNIVDKSLKRIIDMESYLDKYGEAFRDEARFQYIYALSVKMKVKMEDLVNLPEMKIFFYCKIFTKESFFNMADECAAVNRGIDQYMYSIDNSRILNNEDEINLISEQFLQKNNDTYALSSSAIFDVKAKKNTVYDFDNAKENNYKYKLRKDLLKYFYNSSRIYQLEETKQLIIYFEVNQISSLRPTSEYLYNFCGKRYKDSNYIRSKDIKEQVLSRVYTDIYNENIDENNPLTLKYLLRFSPTNRFKIFDNLQTIIVGYEHYIKECINEMNEDLKSEMCENTFSTIFKIYNPITEYVHDACGLLDYEVDM